MKKSAKFALYLMMAAGAALLLYPSASDFVHTLGQYQVVGAYEAQVASMEPQKLETLRQQAGDYNRALAEGGEQTEHYDTLMDVSGTMGYIEIPAIGVRLPIGHGTSEETLAAGVGHLEGSSLPVGGESTHCVLTGHRGLPTAKLFSDLDELEVGDRFFLHVLGETLTYEVVRITTVLPQDTGALEIAAGEDLCTLVTCTPYGINSHRLLVRGYRVEEN